MITNAPRIVTKRLHDHEDSHTLDRYLATGGYEALRKALTQGPEWVQEEVSKASVLGRGGAGFPAGRKWSMLRKAEPVYLVVNGDESEPATFKDHMLLERDPARRLLPAGDDAEPPREDEVDDGEQVVLEREHDALPDPPHAEEPLPVEGRVHQSTRSCSSRRSCRAIVSGPMITPSTAS